MEAVQNGGVAVLNVGSSSLKFGLFQKGVPLLRGSAENVSAETYRIVVRDPSGRAVLDRNLECKSPRDLTRPVLESLRSLDQSVPIAAFGHRVVHGGMHFTAPARITAESLRQIEDLSAFAPLHQPHAVETMRDLQAVEPDVPQVACFDTAFHATMPKVEKMFGLPHHFFDEGVRRYGFHGLVFESVIEQLTAIAPEYAGKRIVACQLGSGSSICGIRDGKSLATTMGCTPLDGLLMGTRCGRLDPGIVLYLEQNCGLSADQIADMLYHRSGLLGVSEISADMRKLQDSTEAKARDAIELFCHTAVREIGSVVALLGGVDAVVFSGGIGEHAPKIRERIVGRFDWLGLRIDAAANGANERTISERTSSAPIFVLPADEESVVARQTAGLLGL